MWSWQVQVQQWLPVDIGVGVVVVTTVYAVKDLLRIDLALIMPSRFSSVPPVYEKKNFHPIDLKWFSGNQTEITKSNSSNNFCPRFSTQRVIEIVSNNLLTKLTQKTC